MNAIEAENPETKMPDVRVARHLHLNENIYYLVQEPGLKPPHKRLSYSCGAVQDVVCRIFGNLLPRIEIDEGGRPHHELLDENGRNVCLESYAVESMEEIPALELLALELAMECLQGLAINPDIPGSLQRILAGFQLPDPETNLPLYRLYKDSKGHTRLIVLWGFRDKRQRGKLQLATAAVSMLKTRVDTRLVHEVAEHCPLVAERVSTRATIEDVAPSPPAARPSPPSREGSEALIRSASKMWRKFAADKLAGMGLDRP